MNYEIKEITINALEYKSTSYTKQSKTLLNKIRKVFVRGEKI
jgi:hypothetical protein